MATDNIDILISSFFNNKGFQQLKAALQGAEQKAEQFNGRLRAIQVVMASIATGAALSYAKSITKIAAEYETLIVRLAQTEGGIKEARKTYQQFADTFGASSFELKNVADGFQKLRVAGLSTKDSFRVVKAGAEAISAFGGTSQDLSRLVIGMTQAIGKGTLSMEEMRQQIGEAVPAAMRILSREYGVTIGEMFRKIEKGTVDSREAMLKLADGLEKDFAGSLEAQSRTIQGALGRLSSEASTTLGKLFNEDTSGGAMLVDLINNLRENVVAFIKSFDESSMATIINFFNSMVTLTFNLAPQIANIFVAVASGVNSALAIINTIPGIDGALAGGLIGFALGGPAGIKIGAVIGGVTSIFQSFTKLIGAETSSIKGFMVAALGKAAVYGLIGFHILGPYGALAGAIAGVAHQIYEEFFGRAQTAQNRIIALNDAFGKKLGATFIELGKGFTDAVEDAEKLKTRLETTDINFGSNTAEKFRRQMAEIEKVADQTAQKIAQLEGKAATPEQQAELQRAKDSLLDLYTTILQIAQALDVKIGEGVAKFAGRVADKARAAEAAMKGFEASVTNNKADSALLGLESRTQGVRNQLIKLRADYEKLGDQNGIARVNAEMERLGGLQQQGINNIRAETGAQAALNAAKYEGLRLSTEKQMLDLRIQEAGSIFAGYADKAEQRRLELQSSILSTGQQILQLEKEKLSATSANRQQIELTIAKLKEFQGAQEAALASTSAAGMLAKDTWAKVADTIEGSLKGALKDLIKGTFDAEKALLAMYDKITDAAIEYLFELIKIQLRQQLIGAAGGAIGGGGGLFGAVGGLLGGLFANGGAFKGQVTPFASGGIIRGPTLFGLAGEAGDEAIMPLERVGGKLGVRAVGDGGGSFNITIQAIDTQSGAQFLMKNAQNIMNNLRSADRLNRGLGSIR